MEQKHKKTDLMVLINQIKMEAETDQIEIIAELAKAKIFKEKETTIEKALALANLIVFISVIDQCQGAINAVFANDYEGTISEWKTAVKERVLDAELASNINGYIDELLNDVESENELNIKEEVN